MTSPSAASSGEVYVGVERCWAQMYPDGPSLSEHHAAYDRAAERTGIGFPFDPESELTGKLWEEIVNSFADKGFGENAEILIAMRERFGLSGICEFVEAIRSEDRWSMQRFCDLVTEYEKRIGAAWGSYNRLIVRRGAGLELLIVIDQPGNPDYVPPLVMRATAGPLVQRRARTRRREPRGKPCRRRGSRRVSSRSGRSSDDPDPEPEPRTGAYDVGLRPGGACLACLDSGAIDDATTPSSREGGRT